MTGTIKQARFVQVEAEQVLPLGPRGSLLGGNGQSERASVTGVDGW